MYVSGKVLHCDAYRVTRLAYYWWIKYSNLGDYLDFTMQEILVLGNEGAMRDCN